MTRSCACRLLGVCVLAFLVSPVVALGGEAPPLQTRLKRVALFKNGLAFFVREGTLTGTQRVVLVDPLAAPSHGTFWVSAARSAGLRSVIAREAVVTGEIPAITVGELIRANVGREAVLGAPWESNHLTGTILSVAPRRPSARRPSAPYQMRRSTGEEALPTGPGQYVLVRTATGVVAVNPDMFSRVQFISDDIATTVPKETNEVELEAAFEGQPKAGDWLSISYLAKGMTWAPSYLVDVSDPKQARLSAKAVIINEAEDMERTHVDLITGFPNLRFSDVLSPMAMKADLAGFLQALAGLGGRPELDRGVMSNVAYQVGGFGGGGLAAGRAEIAPSYSTAAAGRVAEDLFLYPLEEVTLAEGETALYPLFTETVPCTEFYQWEIPDYINESDRYVRQQPQSEVPEIVWHSLRLTNGTRVPWTTAPAEILKEGQIIGQDILKYTPSKATAVLRITQATSVSAEQSETELERERDAVTLYGDHFDRVTIEGRLKVANYQDKAISLEIKKTVSGDIKSATPSAEDTVLARGLRRMNPLHELTWTLSLGPGESGEISYSYSALIRR